MKFIAINYSFIGSSDEIGYDETIIYELITK